MNGVELLDKISDIDAGLILESENCGKKASKKKPLFIGAGVVAAAAAVALTVNFLGNTGGQLPVSENLPVLEAPTEFTVGGMGFEGYDLTDISEYENGNPWTSDMNIKVMPVYKSNVLDPDKEKVIEHLLSVAEKFGIDTNTLEIEAHNFGDDGQLESLKQAMEEQNVPPEEIEAELNRVKTMMLQQANVYAENDDLYLSADITYTVGIHYLEGKEILLPEEYRDISTKEKALKTAEYLLEQYKDILGLTDPVIRIDDYGENGDFIFYDKAETDAETILNYSLNTSRFCINEEGRIHVIWLNSTVGCEKVGNYPILSLEEAEQELLSGNYLTSAPYDLQEGDKPAHAEIIYRMDRGCDYALPFYRFLVEVPAHTEDTGTKCYGAYYVCAVGKEYISNPTISFNGGIIGQKGLEK